MIAALWALEAVACLLLLGLAVGLFNLYRGIVGYLRLRRLYAAQPIAAMPYPTAPVEPTRMGLHIEARSPQEAAEKIAAGGLDDCADGP